MAPDIPTNEIRDESGNIGHGDRVAQLSRLLMARDRDLLIRLAHEQPNSAAHDAGSAETATK
jgi:hypothetical protein